MQLFQTECAAPVGPDQKELNLRPASYKLSPMMSHRTLRIVALVLALVTGISGAFGYNFVDNNNIREQSREQVGTPFDCILDL